MVLSAEKQANRAELYGILDGMTADDTTPQSEAVWATLVRLRQLRRDGFDVAGVAVVGPERFCTKTLKKDAEAEMGGVIGALNSLSMVTPEGYREPKFSPWRGSTTHLKCLGCTMIGEVPSVFMQRTVVLPVQLVEGSASKVRLPAVEVFVASAGLSAEQMEATAYKLLPVTAAFTAEVATAAYMQGIFAA